MTIKHLDGTLKISGTTDAEIDDEANRFVQYCKRFCTGVFQAERGNETGYLHFQVHLIWNKPLASKHSAVKFFQNTPWSTINLNPTCNTVVEELRTRQKTLDQLYAAKEATRVRGPWKIEEEDEDDYIPRQIREIVALRPWQEWVVQQSHVWDTRTIHIIYDPNGNTGKSTLCGYMEDILKLKVFQLAIVKDHERLEADMCCQLRMQKCRQPNAILVDLPRSLPKDNMNGMFAAIERIKTGRIIDTRLEHKKWKYDCPNIFVFSNVLFDFNMLSPDRWVFHAIENMEISHMSLDYANEIYNSKKRKI